MKNMKPIMKAQKTVLVAMSGGVDSSVAALLLKREGYKVIGAFMKNFSDTKNPLTNECSYVEEKKMARKIAAILRVPLVIFDFEKQYKKYVISPMFISYAKGLTPNPDILCNKIIKFPLLWGEAKRLGADYIATGHYARIKKTKLGHDLLAGKDKLKDQSYFLAGLSQSDLSHALFPLENLTKVEVRKIAKKNNFPNWDKKGTRGICFVGKINMQSFLKQKIKGKRGNVMDREGSIIGMHEGIFYYTIGQRAGQRIGIEFIKNMGDQRFYIAKKIKHTNTLIVVPRGDSLLKRQLIRIKSFHLINPAEKIPKNLKARIRHLGILYRGKLIKKGNKFMFKFKESVDAIAEGQFIVVYSGNKVIGGGEIRV